MDVAVADGSSTGNSVQQYFAKYLTSQNLLELQLGDSNFRRYILLQFLIMFQYLDSPVKFKQLSSPLTSILDDSASFPIIGTSSEIRKS